MSVRSRRRAARATARPSSVRRSAAAALVIAGAVGSLGCGRGRSTTGTSSTAGEPVPSSSPAPSAAAAGAPASSESASSAAGEPSAGPLALGDEFEVFLVNGGTAPVTAVVLTLYDGSTVARPSLAGAARERLVLRSFPCRVAHVDSRGRPHSQDWDFGPCMHSGRGSLDVELSPSGRVAWNLLHGDFFNE